MAASALAGTARAADAPPPPTPAAVAELFGCRKVAGDAARLACFDQAAAALETATANRDVVVADQAEVRRARKSLFGFTLPKLALFGSDEDRKAVDEKRAERGDVDEIESKVTRAAALPYGRWSIALEEGGTWRTTEEWKGYVVPKAGGTVTVRRGPLGSYLLKLQGGRGAVHAERVN